MVKNTLNRWAWERWNEQGSKVNSNAKSDKQVLQNREIEAHNKLAEIREQIQNGSYKIDLGKTSEKMALNLLNLQD